MNGQNELFPMSRSSDPDTSHEAADKHANTKLSERRMQVLKLVRRYPGRTQGELAWLMKGYDLPMTVCAATPHKRLPELETLGLVRRDDPRKCRDSGHMAATWWITNKGNNAE